MTLIKISIALIALYYSGQSLAFTPTSITNSFTARTSASASASSIDTTRTKLYATAENKSFDEECDVLVLGSGPAARAIATLLSSKKKSNLDVLLADANYDRAWPPNYGIWQDEWESIQKLYGDEFGIDIGEKCIDRKWQVTDCFFGGSFDIPTTNRYRLDRPYIRVDKNALQDNLSLDGGYRIVKANHVSDAMGINLYSPAGSLIHDEDGSSIQLQTKGSDSADVSVRAKLIVDCTGHETNLVLKETKKDDLPPGFQIAYGALVTVDESEVKDTTRIGPYFKEAMTLFDYRTDHFKDETSLQKAENAPTFMYAMPLEGNKIFFEETSLVARPAISFQECKDRCFTRLEHLGIKVVDIEEEEFCYIPMGGPLPAKDQRIVGFGGASAMVHPSTGYNIGRNMIGAGAVANAIIAGLDVDSADVNLDQVAGSAYHAMWSPANQRQRNFAVFGGEYLMKQKVEGLRGFFDGFFRLPLEMWAGFLAGWPGLPNNDKHETWIARLAFGLTFVSKLPPKVGLDMFLSIVTYSISNGIELPQSVTPLFGEPESYEYVEKPKNQGDVAAKNEARKMIMASKVEEIIPVPFEEDVN
uniref:lycopene beta-cyclase n=1 Tax=Chaetoceros debilis TaxID=122233 RepID=A0A7S3V617_9STRA